MDIDCAFVCSFVRSFVCWRRGACRSVSKRVGDGSGSWREPPLHSTRRATRPDSSRLDPPPCVRMTAIRVHVVR